MSFELISPTDLDVDISIPKELRALADRNLVNIEPWHIYPREKALRRLAGLRKRYTSKYVSIAYRQDNDDLACIEPATSPQIVLIHDFANEGTERRRTFPSFWDWFRSAIEDMILFE